MTLDNWEDVFSKWARPLGKTEEERSENAIKSVKNAIDSNNNLKNRDIEIFIHGSYRNNTNIQKDSDVDIGILCYDTYYYDLPEGCSIKNFEPATYDYSVFKMDVGISLISYFGSNSIERGNKAYRIRENSYHVDADIAPFFEHRRYSTSSNYISGVELRPDNGGKVINWPKQHFSNGVNKNQITNKRYKKLVRIIKKLCIDMQENNISHAKNIPGFLIECLIWNVPNNNFGNYYIIDDVRSCLAYLFNNTMNNENCDEWGEVSELIYLFKGQKGKRQLVHNFIDAAWDYIGFK